MSVERKTWKEFQDLKLLWWINRILHTFGWAIVIEVGDGVIDAYPARVSYRGFSEDSDEKGYLGLTKYLNKEAKSLLADVEK